MIIIKLWEGILPVTRSVHGKIINALKWHNWTNISILASEGQKFDVRRTVILGINLISEGQ